MHIFGTKSKLQKKKLNMIVKFYTVFATFKNNKGVIVGNQIDLEFVNSNT